MISFYQTRIARVHRTINNMNISDQTGASVMAKIGIPVIIFSVSILVSSCAVSNQGDRGGQEHLGPIVIRDTMPRQWVYLRTETSNSITHRDTIVVTFVQKVPAHEYAPEEHIFLLGAQDSSPRPSSDIWEVSMEGFELTSDDSLTVYWYETSLGLHQTYVRQWRFLPHLLVPRSVSVGDSWPWQASGMGFRVLDIDTCAVLGSKHSIVTVGLDGIFSNRAYEYVWAMGLGLVEYRIYDKRDPEIATGPDSVSWRLISVVREH